MIKIDWELLCSDELHPEIGEAFKHSFGVEGFGGVVITNVPSFASIRESVLKAMFKLSQEPRDVLDRLVQPNQTSLYEVGWHEKQMNSPKGKSSNRFVSFFSRFPRETVVFPQEPTFEKENINIWPSTEPRLKSNMTKLNHRLTGALRGLLKYCDRYLLESIEGYVPDKFVRSFYDNYSNANRLIAYRPLEEFASQMSDPYSWDNWHTDFGLFTTVAHPIYLSRTGEVYNTDETCFVLKDRNNIEHTTAFSQNEFLIIAGDAIFHESGGYIPATPHTVRVDGDLPANLYRIQSVSFFEPNLNYELHNPSQDSVEKLLERGGTEYAFEVMKEIGSMKFYKDFLDKSLESLYGK